MNNKKKTESTKSHAIRNLWIIFGALLVLVILFFICVATGVFGTMPTFEELENPRTNLATEIYSADGKVLGTYYVENRSNVRYAELSHYMPEALISIEDERFTEHSGIDTKALFRVAYGVLTGNKKGGGSTITQQLAKNLFPRGENLSKPKLVLRKFQEWITATKLEHNYSKEEIVAMYLNTVAFGHNAFGIRSAANTFFDKKPSEMTLEECALMAGVVNAPTRYSPIRNPERSMERRNLVLRKMAENGFITQAECDSVSQIPLDMTHFSIKDHNTGQATYFREYLRSAKHHFPNIYAKCLSIGIDITKQYIPVAPCAHYMCGGIKVDLDGQSSIKRLYAVGECSCTGLHGGNRLASNSLIEAVVYADAAAKHSLSVIDKYDFNTKIPAWNDEGTLSNEERVLIAQDVKEVGQIMSTYVGIVRSDLRLRRAWERLDLLYEETEDLFKRVKADKEICELRNMINVGYLITRQAMERKESRGLHYSIDYPRTENNHPQEVW